MKNKFSKYNFLKPYTSLLSLLLLLLSLFTSCNQQGQQQSIKTLTKTDTLKKSTVEVSQADTKTDSTPTVEFNRFYDDNAAFIAGMDGSEGSVFLNCEKSWDWKKYASWYNTIWKNLEEGQLKKTQEWAKQELSPNYSLVKNREGKSTLFYPFSGADFLYANTFFPEADQYIMIGLEPAGKVPDIRKIPMDFWENYFLALRRAQDDILSSSFFITKDMQVDFKIQELKGTLPVLMIFLKRTGHKIINVEPVQINDSAEVIASSFQKVMFRQPSQIHGIRITFEKEIDAGNNNKINSKPGKQNTLKTLCYFSFDLSDNTLKKRPEFENFISSFGKATTLIKSASYLMHHTDFSKIRSVIMDHSQTILQDDSGIPLKYFVQQNEWKDFKFYGGYKSPIPIFKCFYQDDLKKRYDDTTHIQPLDFRYGYRNASKKSNLMLAKKPSAAKSA